jgi:hypothetical protein
LRFVLSPPQLYELELPVQEECEHRERYGREGKVSIRLAFPKTDELTGPPEDFHVHATLPLVGDPRLPFYVNADWVTTTNRERVQPGVRWNKLLQEGCFRALLDLLQWDPPMQGRTLRFLPLIERMPDALSSWWREGVRRLQAEARERGLLDSADNRRLDTPELRQLITPEEAPALWRAVGIELLQQEELGPELAELLSVRRVDYQDVLKLFVHAKQLSLGQEHAGTDQEELVPGGDRCVEVRTWVVQHPVMMTHLRCWPRPQGCVAAVVRAADAGAVPRPLPLPFRRPRRPAPAGD